MYRDDDEAMLARLAALDAQVAAHESELAERDAKLAACDARITELEADNADLRSRMIDYEAKLVDANRRKYVAKPVASAYVTPNTPEARAEAERLLAEGVDRYRNNDRRGATECFERGLTLVPGHPQLVRALRRYS